MSGSLHERITQQILSSVDEAGEWKPCWVGASSLPLNGVTRRRYSGINTLLLWCTAMSRGYNSSRWATYRQWKEAGAQVRKGEVSSLVIYYGQISKTNEGGEDEAIRFAKSFLVFNAEQVDGDTGEPPRMQGTLDPGLRVPAADAAIAATGAAIRWEGTQPCYIPALDSLRIPPFEQFTKPEGFYGTTFHELGHWSGAKHRLDRDLQPRFNKNAYAMEELVAEITAAFTCAALGIPSQMREDHAPYIKGWLEVLRGDSRAILTAAAKAAQASDFILSFSQPKEEAA